MKVYLRWIGIGLVVLVVTLLILLAAFGAMFPEGTQASSEVLIVLAGGVLSLVFMYLPGMRVQFAELRSEQKQLINLVLIILLAVGMLVMTCTNFYVIPGILCTKNGVLQLLIYVFLAGGGNQLTYKYSPEPIDVKNAKAVRDVVSG